MHLKHIPSKEELLLVLLLTYHSLYELPYLVVMIGRKVVNYSKMFATCLDLQIELEKRNGCGTARKIIDR